MGALPPLNTRSPECLEAFTHFNCFFCSPQSSLTRLDRAISRQFCNYLMNHCRSAQYKGSRMERFATGTDFCQAMGFRVVDDQVSGVFGYPFYSVNAGVRGAVPHATALAVLGVACVVLARSPFGEEDDDGGEEGPDCDANNDENDDNNNDDDDDDNKTSSHSSTPRSPLSRPRLPLHTLTLALLLAVLLVSPAAANCSEGECCPAYNNRAPSRSDGLRTSRFCRGFYANSCCRVDEAAEAMSGVPQFPDGSDECQQWLLYMACWPCDPDSASMYDRTTREVTMCKSTCNTVYSKCGNAFYKRGKLNEVFSSGTAMCEAMSFSVASDNNNCFDDNRFRYVSGSPSDAWPSVVVTVLVTTVSAVSLMWDGTPNLSMHVPRPRVPFPSRRWLTSTVVLGLLAAVVMPGGLLPTVSAAGMTSLRAQIIADTVSDSITSLVDSLTQSPAFQDVVATTPSDVESKDMNTALTHTLESLGGFFSRKEALVQDLAERVRTASTSTSLRAQYPDFVDADFLTRSDTSTPLTYSTTFFTHINTDTSSVKIADAARSEHRAELAATTTAGSELRETISYSKSLDATFQANAAADSTIRWQYFGSVDGMFRQFPAASASRSPAGFPTDYDPRLRPWFIEASTGPKSLVIAMDCSGSMNSYSDIARAVAKTIISSLSVEDYVNVICSRGNPAYNSRGTYQISSNPEVLGCKSNGLQQATTSTRSQLSEAIDTIRFSGGDNAAWSMSTARSLLASTDHPNCANAVVFITDSHRDDAPCRPGREVCSTDSEGRRSCSWEEPPACDWSRRSGTSWTEAYNSALQMNAAGVPIYTFNIGRRPWDHDIGAQVSCQLSGGQLQSMLIPLTGPRTFGMRTKLRPFYTFLEALSRPHDSSVVWTSPYIDASGLGLVVTAAQAVYTDGTPETGTLLGVVGIDVTLEELESAVTGLAWGTTYAFLTNKLGHTLVHPNLRPSTDVVGDTLYPNIQDLETTTEGEPASFLTTVLPALRARTAGSLDITDAIRLVPRGDPDSGFAVLRQDSRYMWAPLDPDFMVTLVAKNPEDLSLRQLRESATVPEPNIFHRLDKYTPSDGVDIVTAPASDALRPGLTYAPARSTVKFAARSYCRPAEFTLDVAQDDWQDYMTFLNTVPRPINRGCISASDLFEPEVRPDVSVTEQLEDMWKGRSGSAVADVIWSYVGLPSGVFRVFPGTQQPHTYNPTSRPWYSLAITNVGKDVVSYPYLDAFGAGKIVTFSKTATLPATPQVNCTSNAECAPNSCVAGVCLSETVHSVLGVDFKYEDYYNTMLDTINTQLNNAGLSQCFVEYSCSAYDAATRTTVTTTCKTDCVVIDSAAHMVIAPELLDAQPGDQYSYQEAPLARRHADVVADLVSSGVLKTTTRYDWQGKCRITPPWYLSAVSVEGLTVPAEKVLEWESTRGEFPPPSNEFMCVKEVLSYEVDDSVLAGFPNKVATGTVQGACVGGTYYLAPVLASNLYVLLMDNSYNRTDDLAGFAPTCDIMNLLFSSGGSRLQETVCEDDPYFVAFPTCGLSTPFEGTCDSGALSGASAHLLLLVVMAVMVGVTGVGV